MKRQVAGLLTAAMLLSLVGCSKESEETKKKKKKKKPTTESSETEVTDPSESTEDTTASTSDSSDETLPTPPSPSSFILTHDLKMLNMENYAIERAYGEMSSALGEEYFFTIDEQCDYYTLMTDGYPVLAESVEQIFNDQQWEFDAKYDEALAAFPDFLSSLEPGSQPYIDTYISNASVVVRADEQVLSFSCFEYDYDFFDYQNWNLSYYSFDSKTGKKLSLSDVVTDWNRLADILQTYMDDPNNMYFSPTYNEALSLAIDAIRSEENLPFRMYQNCIELMLPDPENGKGMPNACILSAMECSDCLDMSYFLATPLNYALMQDSHGNIVWDFDEDGTVDTLTFLDQGMDENYNLQISLEYNGVPCPAVQTESEMEDIDNALICKTDNGFYLYLTMGSADPVYSTLVFHFENGTFVQVGQTTEFDKYPYNPADCLINTRSELLGTGHKTRRSTLIGGNGMPIPVEDYYAKSGLACTKDDMTLESLGADMNPTGETILIPAHTPIRLIGIDAGQQFAIFTTLNQNEEENRLFKMLVYEDEYGDFDVAYDLKGQIDLFDGMLFAD